VGTNIRVTANLGTSIVSIEGTRERITMLGYDATEGFQMPLTHVDCFLRNRLTPRRYSTPERKEAQLVSKQERRRWLPEDTKGLAYTRKSAYA
jgi:hypothetical protein